MTASVKLACRHLWKVYGHNPSQYFQNRQGLVEDPVSHIQTMRDQQHIVAAGNVSFDIHEGEIFVIMGLSGSGKSTVVRCLSRLVDATAGEIDIDGNNLLEASRRELIEIRRHKMGMVFQNFGLLPHLSVIDNVAFPLKAQGVDLKTRTDRARQMIELVGLAGREQAWPRELSGGQQQRVGIARSLAVEPELWFLDEPFSALDPLIRRQMQDEFIRLQQMLNKTIVFITHDFLEALRLADRICILKDGCVEQIGTPSEVVMTPATDYVREFTQDVPRARVITVGEIMQPAVDVDGLSVIDTHLSLEQAMASFSSNARAVAVSADGQIVGQVSPTDMLNALAQTDGAAS